MMTMTMTMTPNLGKKVPHDLILVAAFLVGGSHVVRHVEDVPENDKDHHHNQDEEVDHHQDGEDGVEAVSMICTLFGMWRIIKGDDSKCWVGGLGG